MPVGAFSSGQRLSAADLNKALDHLGRTKWQKSDLTKNNNTSYTNSTDLLIPCEAVAVYKLDSSFLYDSGTTPDIKIRLTFPTGTFGRIFKWGQDTGATGAAGSINVQALDDTSDIVEWAYGGAGSGVIMSATPGGIFSTGVTPGDIVVGFAQNTANVSNTLLKIGSMITVIRIE